MRLAAYVTHNVKHKPPAPDWLLKNRACSGRFNALVILEAMMNNYQRAKKVIQQFKNNEWKFQYNKHSREALTADRGSLVMWCGNGGFFTNIRNDKNTFGMILRHWVYWAGIRPKKIKFEKNYIGKELMDVDKESCKEV